MIPGADLMQPNPTYTCPGLNINREVNYFCDVSANNVWHNFVQKPELKSLPDKICPGTFAQKVDL
jgi:hypothetical protein